MSTNLSLTPPPPPPVTKWRRKKHAKQTNTPQTEETRRTLSEKNNRDPLWQHLSNSNNSSRSSRSDATILLAVIVAVVVSILVLPNAMVFRPSPPLPFQPRCHKYLYTICMYCNFMLRLHGKVYAYWICMFCSISSSTWKCMYSRKRATPSGYWKCFTTAIQKEGKKEKKTLTSVPNT